MAQAFNPYLPGYEYIPDGEPRVVDGRVYVYGSHDRFGAPMFCVNDYVCWSAPVDDLSAWRYEGVIYKRDQDPLNRRGFRSLYAPDMVHRARAGTMVRIKNVASLPWATSSRNRRLEMRRKRALPCLWHHQTTRSNPTTEPPWTWAPCCP